MNDFLQSLRNKTAGTQRTEINRKTRGHSYHSENQRHQYFNGYYNNDPVQSRQGPQDHNLTSLLLITIENLSGQIKTLTDNQNTMIAAQKRVAKVIARQALAIESIADHMHDK